MIMSRLHDGRFLCSYASKRRTTEQRAQSLPASSQAQLFVGRRSPTSNMQKKKTGKNKIWSWMPKEHETKIDCWGEKPATQPTDRPTDKHYYPVTEEARVRGEHDRELGPLPA